MVQIGALLFLGILEPPSLLEMLLARLMSAGLTVPEQKYLIPIMSASLALRILGHSSGNFHRASIVALQTMMARMDLKYSSMKVTDCHLHQSLHHILKETTGSSPGLQAADISRR